MGAVSYERGTPVNPTPYTPRSVRESFKALNHTERASYSPSSEHLSDVEALPNFKADEDIMYTIHPTACSLHHTPYTLHPTPYTLHPTFSTLNTKSQPDTLNPTPKILPHAPYTLHSTPYTLHPTPYTLHSTPLKLSPTLSPTRTSCLAP